MNSRLVRKWLYPGAVNRVQGLDESLRNAVKVDVPPGSEEKLRQALDEAINKAFAESGVKVTADNTALAAAEARLADALKQEAVEVGIPGDSAMLAKSHVKGVECILICDAACILLAIVGSVPAGAAAWVGGCVAVCALTVGTAAVIAGAA